VWEDYYYNLDLFPVANERFFLILMNLGKVDPQNFEPALTRERLELETRVLAAALRQSLERGDTEGSNLAHEQIFQLIKVSQELNFNEPVNFPREFNQVNQTRPKSGLPDIDWGAAQDFAPASSASPSPMTNNQVVPVSKSQSYLDLGVVPAAEGAACGSSGSEEPAQSQESASVERDASVADLTLEFAVEAKADVDADNDEAVGESDLASGFAVGEDVGTDIVGNMAPPVAPQVSFSPEPEPNNNPLFDFMAIWSNPKPVKAEESAPQVPPAAELPIAQPKSLVESGLDLVLKVTDPSLTALTAATNPLGSLYELLAVPESADGRTIHRHCLVKVKTMLRQPENFRGPNRRASHRQLQELWIARDILCDPATRADYDFRRLGLRGAEAEEVAKMVPAFAHTDKSRIRIGELLLCAELLEQTELEIAADMHKAMPEMLFGAFLVKQEFIAESDLECVLLSQQLIRTGKLTIAQFKAVMDERRELEKDISDILLDNGLISSDELLEAYRAQSEDTLVRVPVVANKSVELSLNQKNKQSVDSVVPPAQESVPAQVSEVMAPEAAFVPPEDVELRPGGGGSELKPKANLAIGYAAPAWKDQLDWSMAPEEDDMTAVAELACEQSALAREYTEAPEGLEGRPLSSSGEDTVEIDALPPELIFGSLETTGEVDALPQLLASQELKGRHQIEAPSQAISLGTEEETSEIMALWDVKIPETKPVIQPHERLLEDNLAGEADEVVSVEEEFAMLEAAAQEALGAQFETSAKHSAVAEEELKESAKDAGIDKAYTVIPLSVQMEQASAGSGNWQIVSLPVDALASILLDESQDTEPKTQAEAPGRESQDITSGKKNKGKNKKRR
jgi:hypothetical protein